MTATPSVSCTGDERPRFGYSASTVPNVIRHSATRPAASRLNMVFRKVVEVQEVDKDSYGRTVAWVSVDGKSLNKELLRAGLAWWYRYYAENEHELEKLEAEARKNKIGLWSAPNPIPPWDFRRSESHR